MSVFDTLGTALRSALEEYNETKHRADDGRCYTRAEYIAYQPEDFKPDADDRIYALRLNNTRFKVTCCSTVYFAGVYVPRCSILHCGLVIENNFYVTENGVTSQYSHLVVHALFVKQANGDLKTKLIMVFCNSRNDTFNELAIIVKNCQDYNRAMSAGFVSSIPCFTLIEHLRSEIKKPFDKDWAKRLNEKVEKAGNNMTNCALFAARIFYAVAPSADREALAIKGIISVFKELGFEDSVSEYIKDLKK